MALIGDITLQIFILFLTLFVGTIILSMLANVLIRKFLDPRMARRYSKITARLVQYSILIVGFYYSFTEVLEFDFTAFLASLGLIGIAIAFSSQQVIQNMMAGLLIFITRPVQMEDWVAVGGIPDTGIGRVKDINWTRTVLRNQDGRIVFIPNSNMITSKVVNYTQAGYTRTPVDLEVPYDIDFDRFKSIVMDVAHDHPKIPPNMTEEEKDRFSSTFDLPSIKRFLEDKPNMNMFETQVQITGLLESKYKVQVHIWVAEIKDREMIVSEFLEMLMNRLRSEGISLSAG